MSRRKLFKLFFLIVVISSAILCLYFGSNNGRQDTQQPINLWCIYVIPPHENDVIKFEFKFFKFCKSLLSVSSQQPVHINVITNRISHKNTLKIFNILTAKYRMTFTYSLYSYEELAPKIRDVIRILKPHFSASTTGSYYSQDLFYLSVCLFRLAPNTQDNVIMIDIDVHFLTDISILYQHFSNFKTDQIIGLAYEQSPVYRHILSQFRNTRKNTTLGEYVREYEISKQNVYPNGFPGFNSGVLLLQLHKMRSSERYNNLLDNATITSLVNKYDFRGHLGDQDFFTLIAFDHPELFYTLPCQFNRQLCTWWNTTQYSNLFDFYHQCAQKPLILHGNCNTNI